MAWPYGGRGLLHLACGVDRAGLCVDLRPLREHTESTRSALRYRTGRHSCDRAGAVGALEDGGQGTTYRLGGGGSTGALPVGRAGDTAARRRGARRRAGARCASEVGGRNGGLRPARRAAWPPGCLRDVHRHGPALLVVLEDWIAPLRQRV